MSSPESSESFETTPRGPSAAAATALLAWYDRSARILPWRVGPTARAGGLRPDPYAVWLSEVMLQQTTTVTVAPRFAAFLARWPDFTSLAAAPEAEVFAEWAGLGYGDYPADTSTTASGGFRFRKIGQYRRPYGKAPSDRHHVR